MGNDQRSSGAPGGEPGRDRAALAAALAQLRRGIAAGDPVDLAALSGLADAFPSTFLPGEGQMALLNLADEVDLLVEELERRHAALAEQLRTATRHRRAESAYGGRGFGP